MGAQRPPCLCNMPKPGKRRALQATRLKLERRRHQITQRVQHLVAHGFVRVAQATGADDIIAFKYHGIFARFATQRQPVGLHRINVSRARTRGRSSWRRPCNRRMAGRANSSNDTVPSTAT